MAMLSSSVLFIVTEVFFVALLHIDSIVVSQLTPPLQSCTVCSAKDSCRTNEFCGCDADCEIYKVCCPGWRDCSNSESREPTVPGPYPPFQCHSVSVNAENYWMVSECPPDWQDLEIENNCIRDRNDHTFPPVTDRTTGFIYRNEFCAACNSVVDVSVWGYNLSCSPQLQILIRQNELFVVNAAVLAEYCVFNHFTVPAVSRRPQPGTVKIQTCFPSVTECLPLDQIQRNITQSEYEDLQNGCNDSVIQQLVLSEEQPNPFPYRNNYCALCNNVSELSCFTGISSITPGVTIPFSVTLDIFGDGQIVVRSEVITTNITVLCSQSEVYDPVRKECRQTLLCDGVSIGSCFNASTECNGSLLSLTKSEDSFLYLNSSVVLYNGEVYAIEFNTSDGDPVICVDFASTGIEDTNMTVNYYSYPQAFFILTYIGCSLSVIGTVLVLITYTIFKELRTLPSKILMNLAVALLFANLLILLGGPIVAAFPDVVELCVASGILLHFFFLSQFSWMSIMSLEMTRVFSNASKLKTIDSNQRKYTLLLLYLCVGWGVPLLITAIAIIVNYTKDGLVLYGVLPDGSRGSCWINHLESAVVAFVTPLAVSIIFNFITFIIVNILLCKASRSQTKLGKGGNISFFRVHIAVFSISGLTWVFGFLAILARTSWSWYLFIILNSTQGFIVFLAFLCTKRVAKLYIEKIKPRTRLSFTFRSSTKTSSIGSKNGFSKTSSILAEPAVNETKAL